MKIHKFGDNTSTGTAMAINRSESVLATAGTDCRVHLWSIANGKAIGVGEGKAAATPTKLVKSLTFSADGRLLAGGTYDGEIRIWDMPSMRLIQSWTGHK